MTAILPGDVAEERGDRAEGFSALARGDLASFLSIFDDGVEWINPP